MMRSSQAQGAHVFDACLVGAGVVADADVDVVHVQTDD